MCIRDRNRNLSLEQRIHNAEACQTVEEYKARHAYLHGAGYSREEWDLMLSLIHI